MERPSRDPRKRYDLTRRVKSLQPTENNVSRLVYPYRHQFLPSHLWKELAAPHISMRDWNAYCDRIKNPPNAWITQSDKLNKRDGHLYAELIYSVTENAMEILISPEFKKITPRNYDSWRDIVRHHRSNEFWHNAAVGFISGKTELECRELGIPFTSIYDLPHAANPYEVKSGNVTIVPDLICGYDRSYFMLEYDRATETQKDLVKKYKSYRYLWGNDAFAEKYGIHRPKLLFIFNSYGRMKNTMDAFEHVANLEAKESGKPVKTGPVYFRYAPELDFENNPRVPHSFKVLGGEWQRIANTPTTIYKKAADTKSAA